MVELKSGYITGIAYPDRFQPELAPIWMAATLTALGIAAPDMTATRYCELGCGAGYSLCRLAAANPSMQFVGIDVNAGHITYGQQLAEEAGLGNVAFHHLDLAEVLPDLGAFDFIVANGIYSWVPLHVRDAILDFMGKRLNHGGVAYLHYMTHPGAATFDTFRNLSRLAAKECADDPKAGLKNGLALLGNLQNAKAGFFVAHPAAAATMQSLAKEDAAYIAHEYLNTVFEPCHVAAVIDAAKAVGLDHVGSATPIENIDTLSLPGNVMPILVGIASPAMRETVKDIARNQSLRRDLYMRSPRKLDAAAHAGALRNLVFQALPGAPSAGPVTLETRIGPVEGPAVLLTPILQRVARGPASFAEIERVLAGVPTGLVNQALHVLMGAGVVHPVPQTACPPGPAERLNVVMLDRRNAGEGITAFAAPAIAAALASA